MHKNYCLIDQDGIELNVGVDLDPYTYNRFDELEYFELTSVEVVIKGVGIDILPMLNDKQGQHIASLAAEIYHSEKADARYERPASRERESETVDLNALTRKIFNI
jgi:hypothetical protein